jgi:hypothetical protein
VPTVRASYDLRHRNGDVVRQSGPSLVAPGADGQLLRLVAMTLDGVPEGNEKPSRRPVTDRSHLHPEAPTRAVASDLQTCECGGDEVEVGGEVHQSSYFLKE